MREHQRRPLRMLDHLAHCECLAGAGDAEQHLVLLAIAHTPDQLLDGAALVALRGVVGDELEIHGSLAANQRGRRGLDKILSHFWPVPRNKSSEPSLAAISGRDNLSIIRKYWGGLAKPQSDLVSETYVLTAASNSFFAMYS